MANKVYPTPSFMLVIRIIASNSFPFITICN